MLLPFFEWMEGVQMSVVFRDSLLLYPIIQALHLVALTVFVGAVLIVDFRLLGRGLTTQPLAEVARGARPWLIGSLVTLTITGIPQMTSTAMKQYYSPFFWRKMTFLLIAVIFTFVLRHRVVLADQARLGVFWPKVVGLVSIALWTSVAFQARLIGLM